MPRLLKLPVIRLRDAAIAGTIGGRGRVWGQFANIRLGARRDEGFWPVLSAT